MSDVITRKTNTPTSGAAGGRRIDLFDLWRSVCVWMMLLYHAAYDLMLFGLLPAAVETHPAARVYCALCAGGFALLSGICIRFSRSPLRRGLLVFLAGMLVTAVTVWARMPVYFGILHLLGVCMLLYGLLRRWIERLPGDVWAVLACLLLFAAAWVLTANLRVEAGWLFPLGLRREDFYSADYYPLLPWGLLFLTGTLLGRRLDAFRDAPALQRRFPAALTFCGRHSLIVYLLHQPLFFLLGFWLKLWLERQ